MPDHILSRSTTTFPQNFCHKVYKAKSAFQSCQPFSRRTPERFHLWSKGKFLEISNGCGGLLRHGLASRLRRGRSRKTRVTGCLHHIGLSRKPSQQHLSATAGLVSLPLRSPNDKQYIQIPPNSLPQQLRLHLKFGLSLGNIMPDHRALGQTIEEGIIYTHLDSTIPPNGHGLST